MKRLLSFMSKGSKITKILTYVYRGLVVAYAAWNSGFDALKKERPEDKAYAKLEGIAGYLSTAISAVGAILDWLGINSAEEARLAREESSNTALERVTKDLSDAL